MTLLNYVAQQIVTAVNSELSAYEMWHSVADCSCFKAMMTKYREKKTVTGSVIFLNNSPRTVYNSIF